VTASISVSGTILATGQSFTLISPTVSGKISFTFEPAVGLYFPSTFNILTNTPEPSTLASAGTGVIFLLGMVRRKRRIA
jgi:hypothetical protein